MIRFKKLRVDKRTKKLYGRYRYDGVTYFRLRSWGFYLFKPERGPHES